MVPQVGGDTAQNSARVVVMRLSSAISEYSFAFLTPDFADDRRMGDIPRREDFWGKHEMLQRGQTWSLELTDCLPA